MTTSFDDEAASSCDGRTLRATRRDVPGLAALGLTGVAGGQDRASASSFGGIPGFAYTAPYEDLAIKNS